MVFSIFCFSDFVIRESVTMIGSYSKVYIYCGSPNMILSPDLIFVSSFVVISILKYSIYLYWHYLQMFQF